MSTEDQNGKPTGPHDRNVKAELPQNILAGLTVSFAAISLGAAFGLQSGRTNGLLVGILSAGVIAAVTSLLGGTRIQCSGPTAPMTTVTMGVWAAASGVLAVDLMNAGYSKDQFMTVVLLLTAGMLILMAVLRLGKFIKIVPATVISGFMNGIAILIWIGELQKLLGLGAKKLICNNEQLENAWCTPELIDQIVTVPNAPYQGGLMPNLIFAGITCALLFTVPKLIAAAMPKYKSFLPGTLVVIIVMSVVHHFMSLNLGTPSLTPFTAELFKETVAAQIPTSFSLAIIFLALPYALNLTLLAYLDTLLTSLVVDKLVVDTLGYEDDTQQNKELAAQGIANGLVAFIGGIPGAQATIRSVLILKENATLRLAGILSGVFVLVEMLLFQDWVQYIPLSVFAGLLIKVGYDVMDWGPIVAYVKGFTQKGDSKITHLDMFFIAGTTIVTVVVNLNVAVISFTVLFYVLKRFLPNMQDVTQEVTEGFSDED
jgi:SulP family sulfate permease